jgi:hypothetical protein
MGIRYVVRGALVKCSQGSTPTRLNLPQCHGFYASGEPVLIDIDREPNVNILPFGRCSALKGPCTPCTAPYWDETQRDALISKRPALIAKSVLSCSHGGIITVENDGQLS